MFRKILRFTLVFSLLSGVIGFLVYLISLTGIFTPKAIDYKYCYIYNEEQNELQRVWLAFKIENAYRINDYYSGVYKDKVFAIRVKHRIAIPYDIKAEVLSYTEDSVLARVRIEWEVDYTPFTYRKVGYVPKFTLHDTLMSIK